MSYVTGADRHQSAFLPPAIEDYVEKTAPVRVIDAFVNQLDFSALGFGRAIPASIGRPGYDPRDMLKLYVYGYLNEVRSSRRLERECRRNLELMWLVRRLAPDHKTIADFRRDNGAAIVGACRAFVLFCRDQGLFAARLLAIDGAKFRAAASPIRVMDRRRIAEEAEKVDARIASYLTDLDKTDANEPADDPGATAKAIVALKERRVDLDLLSARLDQDARSLVVDGELDARPMGFGRGGKPPSYNVQTAVDADTGFIVHHEVTDEVNDTRMLHPIAKAARDLLEREELIVVADTGYSNGNAAAACEADGITACVAAKRSVNNRGDGTQFDRADFTYDAAHDQYTCPEGRLLRRKGGVNRNGYYYVSKDCSNCALKPRCTQAEVRWVSRHQHEDALERMSARVVADPGLMRRRRCSVEHPFGTMKRMMSGRFLTRGLPATRTEMALSVLAYNMIRSINLRAQAS
ncbi:IS1182 family transposase [Methylosinus sp. Sm6]|uniref:IS1182 family transposase n=1 Tax=Methylosinus sp. Sm6 TaxID=2866948 RepID=UPI001C99649D|nr:IS1182 family transposase [Methylosinus sp. Sm6]MBY6239584.1 IS1182 family transposase [Methylosinus sp. Sm6]